MLRVENRMAAERWNEDLHFVGGNAGHMPSQNSGVASFNPHSLNRDQLKMVFSVLEFDALQNAPGNREVCRMIASDRDGAVARFGQILNDRLLRKRPELSAHYDACDEQYGNDQNGADQERTNTRSPWKSACWDFGMGRSDAAWGRHKSWSRDRSLMLEVLTQIIWQGTYIVFPIAVSATATFGDLFSKASG